MIKHEVTPQEFGDLLADFNNELDSFAADLARIFKPQLKDNLMPANNNDNKTVTTTETSADGSTATFTVNTNGGNYNREIKGTVVQGDVYENGKKQPKT